MQARSAPLTPAQTPVDNARHEALTPVDNGRRVAPAPGDDCKRRCLSSLGVDLEEASCSMLLAATRELLHFLMDGKQSLALETWSGHQLVVACPKESQTAKAFASKAKKSGWVDALPCTDKQKEGMSECLSTKNNEEIGMCTHQAGALGAMLQLSGNEVRHARARAKLELGVTSEHGDKIVKEMEEGPEPVFGKHALTKGGKVVEDNI